MTENLNELLNKKAYCIHMNYSYSAIMSLKCKYKLTFKEAKVLLFINLYYCLLMRIFSLFSKKIFQKPIDIDTIIRYTMYARLKTFLFITQLTYGIAGKNFILACFAIL